jgi:hypothetical protein
MPYAISRPVLLRFSSKAICPAQKSKAIDLANGKKKFLWFFLARKSKAIKSFSVFFSGLFGERA